MDPEGYQNLAEELVERKDPCSCRAAIGRAYYGAFNVAASLFRRCGVDIPESGNAHGAVRNILLGVPDLSVAGSKLGSMHSARLDADYKIALPGPEKYETALLKVKTGREIIEAIKGISGDAAKSKKAADEIRRFAEDVLRLRVF